MCVNFTNLNKVYLKDHYPLPSINMLVYSNLIHVVVSFLDSISGYHRILMNSEDAKKNTFITDKGVFCYKIMLFGLKNIGVTYQRLMTEIFKDLIGTMVEVYVDDIVVKSCTVEDHLNDIQ